MSDDNAHVRTDIEVRNEGIKVGWNLAALIAATVLGLYLGQVLAPLKEQLSTLDKEFSRSERIHEVQEAELKVLDQKLRALELTQGINERRLQHLEQEFRRYDRTQ
jgi:hypothetical protein